MRILEEYKKSGFFWLPSNSNHKVPGTLQVFDGGRIELEIIGLLDESLEALNSNEALSRVVGHIEKEGFVTLENCLYMYQGLPFGGITKSTLHAHKMLAGVAYDEGEETLFNELQFTVDGLDDWIGLSGIRVENNLEKHTSVISFEPLEKITYNLNDDLDLIISFTWTFPGMPHHSKACITQQTFFRLTSLEPKPLDNFIAVAYQLTNFLCLAIDETISLSNVIVKADEILEEYGDGKIFQVPIKVFYQSRPFSKEVPNIYRHGMLFRFKDIYSNFGNIINRWLEAYDVIAPALGLYFAAKSGDHRYLDGRFLALVQGLETYHRRTSDEMQMDDSEFQILKNQLIENCPEDYKDWLAGKLEFGNEITLAKRIRRIIEPFKSHIGNSPERSKLIRKIVDTRNYFTHYSPSLKSRAAQKRELVSLCEKLEAFFQLQLLGEIGFTQKEIEAVLNQNYKLKNKLTTGS